MAVQVAPIAPIAVTIATVWIISFGVIVRQAKTTDIVKPEKVMLRKLDAAASKTTTKCRR